MLRRGSGTATAANNSTESAADEEEVDNDEKRWSDWEEEADAGPSLIGLVSGRPFTTVQVRALSFRYTL
jgi:hypothetical protein